MPMELELCGQFALVTGASRGIGRATAIELAREGAVVIAVARESPFLKTLKEEFESLNSDSFCIAIDLQQRDAPQLIHDELNNRSVVPNIVVNNYGGNLDHKDVLSEYSIFEEVFWANLGLAIEINRLFLPSMMEKKYGRICHVSSLSGLEQQGPPSYCAAKAALNAYVRSVGRFVAEYNISMTSILPGPIKTEQGYWEKVATENPAHLERFLSERVSGRRLGDVSEISALITFLVSKHSSFMVGSSILADGGQGRSFQNNQD